MRGQFSDFLLILILILFRSAACAQSLHGTAIFILTTDRDVIVAADSLGTDTLTRERRVAVCKIISRGNSLVTVAGLGALNGTWFTDIALEDPLFGSAKTDDDVSMGVEKWSNQVLKTITSQARVNLAVVNAGPYTPELNFSQGVFLVIGSDGKLIVRRPMFGWNPDAPNSNFPVHCQIFVPRPNLVFGLAKGEDMISELKAKHLIEPKNINRFCSICSILKRLKPESKRRKQQWNLQRSGIQRTYKYRLTSHFFHLQG